MRRHKKISPTRFVMLYSANGLPRYAVFVATTWFVCLGTGMPLTIPVAIMALSTLYYGARALRDIRRLSSSLIPVLEKGELTEFTVTKAVRGGLTYFIARAGAPGHPEAFFPISPLHKKIVLGAKVYCLTLDGYRPVPVTEMYLNLVGRVRRSHLEHAIRNPVNEGIMGIWGT